MSLDLEEKEQNFEDSHPSMPTFGHVEGQSTPASRPGGDQAINDHQQKFYKGVQLKSKEKSVESLDPSFYDSDDKTEASESFAKKITGTIKQNKKTTIFGGAAGGIILTAVLGIGALVPYELVHLEKTLIKYEAKLEQHFEQKAEAKLLQKMVCQQVVNGCSNDPEETSAEDTEPKATATSDAASNNEDLANDIENEVDLTSPAIQEDLAKAGITEKLNAAHQLTELDDASGNITDQIVTDPVAQTELEQALPERAAGDFNMETTSIDQADTDFEGLPEGTPEDEVNKDVESEITNGANNGDVLETVDEDNKCTPPSCESDETPQDTAIDNTQSGELGKAENIVDQDIAAGDTVDQAVTDAAGQISGDLADNGILGAASNGLILNIANYACDIENAATKSSKTRVPTIQKLLVRHAALLFSLADQLKSGHLTSSTLNGVMKLFNGSSAVKPTADDPNPESNQSVTASAGYQRATGGSGGFPIDTSSLPEINAGTALVTEINGIIPGGDLSCHILESPAGFLVQGLGAAIQFFADDFTFGAAEGATIALNVGTQAALKYELIPDIIKYFTPVGVGGAEDSVQWFNNADAGTNLMYGSYSRSIGGLPMTNDSADSLSQEANTDTAIAEAQEPLSTRLFAISNPGSLISHIIGDLPIGLVSSINNIENYFIHFPSIALRSFSSIFTHKLYAQATPENPGEPYGITQYALTDTQATQFDPIQNENFLFSPVNLIYTYVVVSPVTHKKVVVSKTVSTIRMSVLGNPSTYSPVLLSDNTLGDSSANDLLHCFEDSYATIEEQVSVNGVDANNNCDGIGNYDYYPTANSTAPDIPSNSQLNTTIIGMYCTVLNALVPPKVGTSATTVSPPCTAQVASQMNDDIERYSEYLLDLHVMNNYVSLTTNK